MPLTPAILEVFLNQCGPTRNDGITVLTHPGDFFGGWGWFERFCTALGKQYASLNAGRAFSPDITAYPPRPGFRRVAYNIQVGDFFGGMVALDDGGRIVMRRSSSSDVHKPTMELQGLAGLKAFLANKAWLSRRDARDATDATLRVEIKFQGALRVLAKKKSNVGPYEPP
jgi:hypothetical protein